jgi:hypothetical protein
MSYSKVLKTQENAQPGKKGRTSPMPDQVKQKSRAAWARDLCWIVHRARSHGAQYDVPMIAERQAGVNSSVQFTCISFIIKIQFFVYLTNIT